MKIAITGATGFVGGHVVQELLSLGDELTIIGRSSENFETKPWPDGTRFIEMDIAETRGRRGLVEIAKCDKLIHLAWEGLPNYKDIDLHVERNLMSQYYFLKGLLDAGLKDLTVTGTCFEYGKKDGCLSVDLVPDPQNPYAIAKDSLRRFLWQLKPHYHAKVKWVRLFYMYGDGQSPRSLLSLLDKALEDGDDVFNMSPGEQLRDYLPVEEVAKRIVRVARGDNEGIFNCCSGEPISIRKLVENHIAKSGKTIDLNLGYYDYPDYEAMAFWGQPNIS